MHYVDGYVLAVPNASREAYTRIAETAAQVFLDCGAVAVSDGVGCTCAARTLRRYRPGIVMDTHNFLGGSCTGIHEACAEYLTRAGYPRLEHVRPGRFAGALIAYPN